MSNLVQNGGFESESGWTIDRGAETTAAAALFGSLGLSLDNTDLLLAPRAVQTGLGTTPGDYTLTLYVQASNPLASTFSLTLSTAGGYGSCSLDIAADGTWSSESPIGTPYQSGSVTVTDWNKFTVPLTVTAPGGAGSLRLFTDLATGARWYVDGVQLRRNALFTETINAAILSDIGDINGAGIFTSTVAEVAEYPKRWNEMKPPAVIVSTGEGEDVEGSATAGFHQILATQNYGLTLYVHDATPRAALRALMDDIRNALQRSTSATRTATSGDSGVLTVYCRWGEPAVGHHESHSYIRAEANVAVEYKFVAGTV